MKRSQKLWLIRIIISTIGLYGLYSLGSIFVEMGDSLMDFGMKKEPSDYKEVLQPLEPRLEHIRTFSKDSLFPVSTYRYDSTYRILVFKRKQSDKDFLQKISFQDQSKNINTNRIYTSFGGVREMQYSFKNIDSLFGLDIFLEGFKEGFIQKKTKDCMYLSFPLKNNFSLSFNDSKKTDLVISRDKSIVNEYNELLIGCKEDEVYFIYLKPYIQSDSVQEFVLKEVLSSFEKAK